MRSVSVWAPTIILLALAAVLCAYFVWSGYQRHHLILASGRPGGAYLPLAEGIAAAVREDRPSMRIHVVEGNGSEANLTAIENGHADLGIVQNDARSSPHVRVVTPLHMEVLHILRRRDVAIESLHDLRGRRVAVGREGSGTENLVRNLLRHYGMTYDAFEASHVGTNAAVDALIAGEIDVLFMVTGLKSDACQRAVDSGQVTFVSIGSPDVVQGEVEGFRLEYPHVQRYVIPVLTYSSSASGVMGEPATPTSTLAVNALLVCRSDLDTETAYTIAAAIHGHRHLLASTHEAGWQVREVFNHLDLQYPLHAGAAQYYQRNEPGFLVTYAETMGFLLSVLVTLMAALTGLRAWIGRVMKNRMDVYYQNIGNILNRLEAPGLTSAKLVAIEDSLDDLRSRAFKDLIAENLRADEAFLIFQTLMAECRHRLETHPSYRPSGRPATSSVKPVPGSDGYPSNTSTQSLDEMDPITD